MKSSNYRPRAAPTSRKFCLFASAGILLCDLISPATATADTFSIHYLSTGQPAGTLTSDYVRAMMAALREWDYHSQGAAQFRLFTLDDPNASCTGNNIRIRWDPSMVGSSTCAETESGSHTLCNSIRFNPGFALAPNWLPTAVGKCNDFQASLLHELGHFLQWNPDHTINSVRNPSNGIDLIARHVWNTDMSPALVYSRHWYGIRMEIFDPSSLLLSSTTDWTAITTLPTVSVAPGDLNSTRFSWFYGDNAGVHFRKGDGTTATVSEDFAYGSGSSSEYATYHGSCLASDRVGHYVAAWPTVNEIAAYTNSDGTWNVHSGARIINYMYSSDRGATWSAVSQIQAAFTRTGISCSYDASQDKFVLAFAGYADERLYIVSKPAAVNGSWTSPVMVMNPTDSSMGPPSIAFDALSGSTQGWLAWMDNSQGSRMGAITFSSTFNRYQAVPGTVTSADDPGTLEDTQLQSPIVIGEFNSTPSVAYAINPAPTTSNYGTNEIRVKRATGAYPGPRSTAYTSEYSPPSNLAEPAGLATEAHLGIGTPRRIMASTLLLGPN